MSAISSDIPVSHLFTCESVSPSRTVPSILDDVRDGLLRPPRTLPPKYFYDERGSNLFDQICDREEYYPTRTEDALLAEVARDVIAAVEPTRIFEFGAGASRKTRRLLDACDANGCRPLYVPFDVCEEIMVDAGRELVARYDWLNIQALVGDYNAGLDNLPDADPAASTLYLFLGGTVGNFDGESASTFLAEIAKQMQPADRLLIGADRVKDPAQLHAAYNDAAGITEAFNLNLLNVLNRELDGNFDPGKFHHHACYNPEAQRVEMHLIASEPQAVALGELDEVVEFREGDNIQTEVSNKFTRESFETLLEHAGLAVDTHFESDTQPFSLVLARRND